MKRIAILFFIILILLFLTSKCSLEVRRYFVFSIPFDEKRWKINDAETRWEIRPGMARDLIKRKLLIGKSCAEIDDLLNMYPTPIDCNKKTVKFNLKVFFESRIMGAEPEAAEFLKLYLDENKKVKKAEISLYTTGGWRD